MARSVSQVLKNSAGGADPDSRPAIRGENVMQFLKDIVMNSAGHARGARYWLVRLLGYGRDLVLAVWAVGVLAFCVLGLAGAMI